jgi:cytochrome c oxidase subunit 2
VKVHTYEKAFLITGGIVLVACGAALIYASLGMGLHLPGAAGRVEPLRVYSTAPFNRPGVRLTAPNQYEAVVVAQSWAFNPAEIRVPAGAEVTITATSVDIIHGLAVAGTRVNMMLIPGQISRNTYRFDAPGEYLLVCHEYCGLGHHTMYGKLIVEPSSGRADAAAATAGPSNAEHHQ